MNDPWARPTGGRPVVEIELTGGEPTPVRFTPRTGEPAGPDQRPSRGRRAGAVLVGAVVVVGVVVAVTTAGGDDDAVDTTATSFDASRITTPPTLPELGALPPITEPAGTTVAGPASVDPADREPPYDPESLTVPTFDVVPNVAPDALGGYDLLGAIAANSVGGTPMRTKLRLDGIPLSGVFRTALDVTVSNDPDVGIDSLVVQGNVGERAEIVFDRATQSVLRTDSGMDGQWERFASDDFLAGTGSDQLDALFDSFATGPISPAAVAGGTVEPADGLVRLNGGAIARLYRVTVPVEALQPYGMMLIANVYEQTIAAGQTPATITFDAYVTDQPALALVTARFEVDDTVYLLQQYFDRRPANVLLELPAPDTIIDGPVTGAPAEAPVTTLPPVATTSSAADTAP